jgi:hypothetical protein
VAAAWRANIFFCDHLKFISERAILELSDFGLPYAVRQG